MDISLDHMRERHNILNSKLVEIQGKRDSLYPVMLRIAPVEVAMKHAGEYIESAGMDCSSGSSREKRLAHVMTAIPEFWIRNAKVKRTAAAVEVAFKHLEGQYECISRLITALQIKAKIGEISRGENLFEDKSVSEQPRENEQAAKAIVAEQPVQPGDAEKYAALDRFDPTRAVASNGPSGGTRQVDF